MLTSSHFILSNITQILSKNKLTTLYRNKTQEQFRANEIYLACKWWIHCISFMSIVNIILFHPIMFRCSTSYAIYRVPTHISKSQKRSYGIKLWNKIKTNKWYIRRLLHFVFYSSWLKYPLHAEQRSSRLEIGMLWMKRSVSQRTEYIKDIETKSRKNWVYTLCTT